MNDSQRRLLRAVRRLLSRADRFNQLAKTCPSAYRVDFYRLKHLAIGKAICLTPRAFIVDSVDDKVSLTIGITHVPSGRRAHLRLGCLPPETKALVRGLVKESLCRRGERARRVGRRYISPMSRTEQSTNIHWACNL